jgi:hypothetical protein
LWIWGEAEEGDDVSISCGTSGCAMGLAVLSGAFEDAGLLNASVGRGAILPKMPSGRTGFEAAVELFDIPYSEVLYLFDPETYPDDKITGAEAERYVAQRIRDLVEARA